MSPYDPAMLALVSNPTFEFVRYFPRQLITAEDMRAEQDYFREKLRQHNRMVHGWGVVRGCEVTPSGDPSPAWQVSISEGYVITPRGDGIYVPSGKVFDLAGDARKSFDPCPQYTPCSTASTTAPSPGKTVYLAVCYTECSARPVRVSPTGCSYDESACEYSRRLESFELVRLDGTSTSPDCVILAQITLPASTTTRIVNGANGNIVHQNRELEFPF